MEEKLHRLLEVLTVAEGVRRVGRIEGGQISNYKFWKNLIDKLGLEKEEIKVTAPKGGGKWLVFTDGKDELQKIKELYQTEGLEVHRHLGDLYGYPKCCVDHYIDSYPLMKKEENLKLKEKTLRKTTSGFLPLVLNNFSLSFILHEPCSYRCKSSWELGRKHAEILQNYDKRFYEYVAESCREILIYDREKSKFFNIKRRKVKIEKGKLYPTSELLPNISENELEIYNEDGYKIYIFQGVYYD